MTQPGQTSPHTEGPDDNAGNTPGKDRADRPVVYRAVTTPVSVPDEHPAATPSTSAAPATSASPAAPPPRRKRHWFRRFFFAIVILSAIVFIAGQIIFSTNLPRNLVINALEKQFGLNISAQSLSTGWLGNTTLKDVTLSLPLADHAFISVPEMRVGHTSLPWLILTRSVTIDSVSIDHPTVWLTQDASGRWNIQDVIQLLNQSGGANTAGSPSASQSSNSIPTLPAIHITDAKLIILDNRNRTTTINPINIDGLGQSRLVWQYTGEIPDHLQIAGRVAPGGNWPHTLTISAKDLGPFASPWIANWPATAGITSATWLGQVDGDRITGRLDVADARWGNMAVNGPLQIAANLSAQGTTLTAQPRGFFVHASGSVPISASATGGAVVYSAGSLVAQKLALSLEGGQAILDGKYSLVDHSAAATAQWQNIAFPPTATQSGDLSLSYAPTLGNTAIKADLHSYGAIPAGHWDADLSLTGAGKSLATLEWSLAANRLQLAATNGRAIDLSGLAAKFTATPRTIALASATLGGAHPIVALGNYDLSTGVWWLSLSATPYAIPAMPTNPLDLSIDAWGNPQLAHVKNLYLRTGPITVTGDGEYRYGIPKPVTVELAIDDQSNLGGQPEVVWQSSALTSSVLLTGDLYPMNLLIQGKARGSHVVLRDRPIGQVDLDILGQIADDNISVAANHIELLGAQWTLAGNWPFKESLLKVRTTVAGLPLATALDRADVSGSVDGDWEVDINRLNPQAIAVSGEAIINQPRLIGNAWDPGIDQIQVQGIDISNGNVNLNPIVITRNQNMGHNPRDFSTAGAISTGAITADQRVNASVQTTLARPDQLSLTFDAANWPVQMKGSDFLAVTSADGKLDLDLQNFSAEGNANLHLDPYLNDKPLGHLDVISDIHHRTITASSISAAPLGGTATGKGFVDLDHPLKTILTLDWSAVDLAELSQFIPAAQTLRGIARGHLEIAPATVAHPLEPLAVNLTLSPAQGEFQGLPFGDILVNGYVGQGQNERFRFVLDDSPARISNIKTAGGRFTLWGRVTQHADDISQAQVVIGLDNIAINDLLRATDSKSPFTPGRINGEMTAVAPLGNLQRAFGDGQIQISNSDLATIGPIALLYGAMHIGHDTSKPVGYGTIDLHLENNRLSIPTLRYFDRGTEVRADGAITNIFNLPDSPIAITAVGSARPLEGLSIPGLGDIDAALSAIQQSVISETITGTVRQPQYQTIPFGQIGQGMKNFLVGDVLGQDTDPDR
jgi:hypothetical protein